MICPKMKHVNARKTLASAKAGVIVVANVVVEIVSSAVT
jgi:hypothetical protein